MKLSRFFIALLAVIVGVAPDLGLPNQAVAGVGISVAPLRHADGTASRSSTRTPGVSQFALVSAAPVSTTTAPPPPTTTAAPPTPTTTTTVVKPRRAAATTTTTATPPLEQTTNAGGKEGVVQVALAQVGKRYRAAATGPNAFDCSGLVFYVFNQAGISIPRLTSDGYLAKFPRISRSELLPGDLVVGSGHIGIYVGGGKMVHASTPRGGVKHAPIDAPGRPIGYVRL